MESLPKYRANSKYKYSENWRADPGLSLAQEEAAGRGESRPAPPAAPQCTHSVCTVGPRLHLPGFLVCYVRELN